MSRSDLVSCVVALRGGAEEAKGKLGHQDHKALLDKSDEVINWLHKNKAAEGPHYAEKLKELEKLVTAINALHCGCAVPY
eukprot:Em0024g490a